MSCTTEAFIAVAFAAVSAAVVFEAVDDYTAAYSKAAAYPFAAATIADVITWCYK